MKTLVPSNWGPLLPVARSAHFVDPQEMPLPDNIILVWRFLLLEGFPKRTDIVLLFCSPFPFLQKPKTP